MAATKKQIGSWFQRGVSDGARWMIIICDKFDWEDYPVYCKTEQDAVARMKDPGDMQKVMECYDLNSDMNEQLGQRRVMALSHLAT